MGDPAAAASGMSSILVLILMFAVMYFIIIRPQKKRDKLLKEICFYILLRKDSLNVAKKKCDELFCQTKYIIGQDNEKYKDISSTLIRQKIKDKEDFSNLVCPEVYKLLIKRHS